MFKNNLKIAWRHFIKNKYISLINLTGLMVGMTAALFIWQYVNYERSYDQFHENADNIYRIRTDRVDNGVPFMQFAAGAAFAAPFMKNNFPEVENYVKLKMSSEAVFAYEDKTSIREEKVCYAMPSLFDVFSFSLLKGDTATCLAEPFTACLSESMAKKMFGNENPIGKVIKRNGSDEYKITGIFEDFPHNSHLKYNILLSYITYSDVFNTDGETERAPYWDGYYSYLQLKPNTDWKALEAKIPAAIEKGYERKVREEVELYLQPLKEIYLTSNYLFEAEANGDKRSVQFLFIIGVLVLLIAWFNYINMSTARSEMRAKEVGVRKVVGSSRGKLVVQFLTEAGLMNVFAIIGSFSLVQILNPFFESLIGKSIPVSIFSDPQLLGTILVIFLLGTLLAGLYPAFLLSSYKPITVLKTGLNSKNKSGGSWLRKGLVVTQFIASIGLIASTLIVYKQLNYMQETKLGVHIDQTLVIKGPTDVDSTFVEKSGVFKTQIEQLASVSMLTSSTTIPGQSFGWTAGGIDRVDTPDDESGSFHAMAADTDYTTAYEMELVAGRHMSKDMGKDKLACMLNEKGVSVLNYKNPEEALGKEIDMWGERFTVTGILKNFHQESPKAVVEPLFLRAMPSNWSPNFYSIKLRADEAPKTIANVEKVWSSVYGGNPFEFFFLDDHFNAQYEADQRFGRIFSLFSGLAIFVSCLGLFALVAFATQRKKKEIGIRKVLGASVPNIVSLISKDFLILVVCALLIASPLTWYIMNGWLDNFVKRIDIQLWIFGIAGFIVVLLAFATVSFQSVKAAMTNPIDSLRNE